MTGVPLQTIFISYSHDSPEHAARVLAFSRQMQRDLDGVARIVLDQLLETDPDEGWPTWCEQRLEDADRVLVVMTPAYRRRYDGREQPGTGLGATYEAVIIKQQVYDGGLRNRRFRTVVFDSADRGQVPDRLSGNTVFEPNERSSYEKLLMWVRSGATNPPDPEPDPPDPGRPRQTTGDWLHAFGSSIDRKTQWLPLVNACRGSDHAFFLVHGHQRQWVELFTYRVWNYLSEECGRHHEFVSVPLRVEYAKPHSAHAWVNHVREALGVGDARLEEALAERARQAPVFIVLSEFPLEPDDLSREELRALTDFLDSRLPAVIVHAAPVNPIRVLVTTQYEGPEEASLVPEFDHALEKGGRSAGIHYEWFPPLQDVAWEDIRAFLKNRDPRPPDEVFDAVRRSFEELARREDLSFRDVVERLRRKLF